MSVDRQLTPAHAAGYDVAPIGAETGTNFPDSLGQTGPS
jgi:hypothetical protein